MTDKQTLLSQVINLNQICEKILESDKEVLFLESEKRNELNGYINNNQDYITRLNKKEIEIAVVGLEKAGKSTFANALLESVLLPSSTERCTFTSTSIRHGEDKAVIQFYTEQEFQQQFDELLNVIECPEHFKVCNFREFDFSGFESYFKNLATNPQTDKLYKGHLSTTYQDLKDILEYKSSLNLTGEKQEITKNIESELVRYIAGEEVEPNSGVRNTALPRSVKKIDIFSSKLKELQNGVIYDVPGFDSPIALHQEQTKYYLNQADIIILVADATRPSLTAPALEMLSDTDHNGVKLKDKLFIFGNRLDKVNSSQEVVENKAKITKSFESYCLPSRVFAGSALRHLKDKNVINTDIEASYKLESSGIDEIRKAVIEYNNIQRVNIIQKNFQENKKNIEILFRNLTNKFSSEVMPSERSILRNLETEVEKLLLTALKDSRNELQAKKDNDELTAYLKNKIRDIQYPSITIEDLRSISTTSSVNNVAAISDLNNRIRQAKYSEIRQDYALLLNTLSFNTMSEAFSIIEDNILKQFENRFPQQANIASHIKEILNIQMKDSQNNAGFEYLFDRFSRSLFDIFLYPLSDSGRKVHFNKAKADFIYLDSYYSSEKKAPYSLIRLLLTQEDNGQGIRNVVTNIDKIINEFLPDEINIATGSFSLLKKAKEKLQTVLTDRGSKAEFLKEFVSHLFKQSGTLDLDIDGLLDEVQPCNKEEDIIKEVNTDMKNIKDMLEHAVVDAMDLDLVFFNSVDKSMDKLRSAIDLSNSNSLIYKIVEAMQSKELAQLEQKKAIYQQIQALNVDIKAWLN
ncbi:dynamin family protein [Actinobacillus minor]|uniref:dynamin family protein n=1 Tax=Actinobacillus minor TaxID=51047 RepID=UPI0026EC2A56|nr:dynamin family protein [Actinobacillus minor]